jgi:hypothetical protein
MSQYVIVDKIASDVSVAYGVFPSKSAAVAWASTNAPNDKWHICEIVYPK